jgi:hypothetical protein
MPDPTGVTYHRTCESWRRSPGFNFQVVHLWSAADMGPCVPHVVPKSAGVQLPGPEAALSTTSTCSPSPSSQPQVTSMLKAPETELVPDPTGNKSSQDKDAVEQPAKSPWDSFDPNPENLGHGEHWWRDHYQWLKEAGYLLRPRYDPAWIPSWRGTKKDWLHCEDAKVAWVGGRIFYVPCD